MAKLKRLAPQKAKNPKKTFKRLFKFIFDGKYYILFFVILSVIISSLVTVFVANMLSLLIDDYIVPMAREKSSDYRPLLKALILWAAIMLVGIMSVYAQARLMVGVSQDALKRLRNEMFRKMEKLPISYFDKHQHGQTMSLFTNDVDTIQQMISQSLVQVISSTLTLVFVFIAMIRNNLIMTAIVILCVCVLLKLTKVIGDKSSKNFALQQKNLAKVNGYIEEIVSGSKVVKVFTHEETAKAEFEVLNEDLRKTMSTASCFANVMGPVSNNIGNLQYVILVFAGSVLCFITGGAYTVGSIAAFLQLSKSFTNPIGMLSQQVHFFLQALAGAERIFALLDEDDEVDDGYVRLVNMERGEDGKLTECDKHTSIWAWKHPHHDGSETTYTPLRGDIVLDGVDFGYDPDKLVLHDISLYAKPGQKIAFVGSTGAGKTTITNLLNRFYDIQDGKIRFDGININKILKKDLRSAVGVILQDTHLFTGTIKENIRFGKLDATDEEIVEAAKLAGAHDFIMTMINGYDTMLESDGEGLSQGQRQLLSIARAAVQDPPVLVMDEATSSIDTHTEQIVQSGMDRLMAGRTVFVIAHRLSTVRNSNAIMVLENGRIIERGNHEDLIALGGKYYALYTGMSELS
ncbi:MAG: ABC transporter ATP-binding protein [Spirochaetales bacterium]|nr:ABC transporter ATP-binding protein [Spirochaetales bacterium]